MPALIENPERYPVLVSGATSLISALIIADYARSGRQAFCILTPEEKRVAGSAEKRFQNTVLAPLENLTFYEGVSELVAPIPIFTNIRDPEAVDLILSKIRDNTHPNQKVHFDSFAAAGFRAIGSKVVRIVGALDRKMNNGGKITVEDLVEATANIRKEVMSEKSLSESRETNHIAGIRIYNGLQKEERLGTASTTAHISSNPTDDFIKGLRINEFYGGISIGKSGGEEEQEALCRSNGQRYLNLVCPVVAGTSAANFAIGMRNTLARAMGEENVPEIQTVTIDQVAEALIRELRDIRKGGSDPISKRYLGLDGLVYPTKPANLRTPMLPYF